MSKRQSDFDAVCRSLAARAARGALDVDPKDLAVELEIPLHIILRILRRIVRDGGRVAQPDDALRTSARC